MQRTRDPDVPNRPAVTLNLKRICHAATQLSPTHPRVILDGQHPPRRRLDPKLSDVSLVLGLVRIRMLGGVVRVIRADGPYPINAQSDPAFQNAQKHFASAIRLAFSVLHQMDQN